MATVKALCMVAHPDDCVIFAYSYIHNHPEMTWNICYLTYCEWEPRAQELKRFWARRSIPCIFLGYTDDYRDIENKRCSFNTEQARREIGNISSRYDLVLTHDEEGDYGHIHHSFVHDSVGAHPRLVTFAPHNQGTVTLTVPTGTYSIEELPQHGEIVQSFHRTEHRNSYKEHV
jgi:LmbE family N-acetylglucosaminyl deacetylase